jgi:hypothetical protein
LALSTEATSNLIFMVRSSISTSFALYHQP